MKNTYRGFNRIEFEREMWKRLKLANAGFMRDITQEWISEGGYTNEHIYSISTRNRAVDILIFSSILYDKRYTRRKGADAVRVVIRWKTKNGILYSRVCKHLRVASLFDNLLSTIIQVQKGVHKLDPRKFTRSI